MQTLPALARLYCSKELKNGLDKQIICLSVINTVLAIAAFVGNTVILIALHKETSLHRPSKALLRNLVASDLCVGFAEIALVGNWNSILQEQWRVCRIFFYAQDMVVVISISVSLCTLTAISVDRLLALLLGLGYRQIVNLRLVFVVVITLSVLIGVGMAILTMLTRDAVRIVSALEITVCLMTSTFCYTRIFVKLRSQRAQVHSSPPSPPQQDQTISLNILRYRKTVFTSLWLQMSLVVCFLPFVGSIRNSPN